MNEHVYVSFGDLLYTAEGVVRGSKEVIQLFQLLVKACDSYSHCSHVLNFCSFLLSHCISERNRKVQELKRSINTHFKGLFCKPLMQMSSPQISTLTLVELLQWVQLAQFRMGGLDPKPPFLIVGRGLYGSEETFAIPSSQILPSLSNQPKQNSSLLTGKQSLLHIAVWRGEVKVQFTYVNH